MGQPVALGWIELYKVFEIVGDSVKPNTLDKIGLATAHDLSAFRASANRPDVERTRATPACRADRRSITCRCPKDAGSSAILYRRGLTRSADTGMRWLYSDRVTERDTAGPQPYCDQDCHPMNPRVWVHPTTGWSVRQGVV